jgi:hypothetical protein
VQVTNVNTAKSRQAIRTFGAVLLGVAVACAPALSYAQHGFGGGHVGGSGGGGHSSGGHSSSGHSSGGFSGGHSSGAHFAGGHAPARGFAGAHYAAPHFAGGAYAAHGVQGTRGVQGTHGFQGTHGYQQAHVGFTARPGISGGHGFNGTNGNWGGGHRYWGGGNWGGRFWPHAYFYPGYAWFLPLLPLGYATFWWGGLPYYYYDNLYYTWNPGYNGYVVTDPPPVAGTDSGDGSDASQYSSADGSADASQYSGAAPSPRAGAQAGAAGDVYVYPRNGQNDQQTSNDRYECHSWAANQTGFDPTRGAQQSGTSADYRRALIACLDARGYTAR